VWNATSGGTQIQSVTLQQSGGAPTNRIATVNSASYSYDAAGNVTNDGSHSYTYDAENRVVSVDGGAATYNYDQRSWRVKKAVGASVTHYIWEGGQVIAEHNGGTGAVIVDYIYAGGRMIAKEEAGARRYFLSDRLSVRVTLDASGNIVGRQAHLPFGEDFAESGTQQKHHLTSYERDAESGLDYAVNRYYGSNVGRFSQVDPMSGSVSNPQSLNRYSYVQNDPVNSTDPSGLLLEGPNPPSSDLNTNPLGFWGNTYTITTYETVDPYFAQRLEVPLGTVFSTTTTYFSSPNIGSNNRGIESGDEGFFGDDPQDYMNNPGPSNNCFSLPFPEITKPLSKNNIKHVLKHLSEFVALDPTFTFEKQVELGLQIARDRANFLGKHGELFNFKGTALIGGIAASVFVVVAASGQLKSVYILALLAP
jgi:RHS repeat-associated protein